MKDLLLDNTGDLFISKNGDIEFTDSIKQAVTIRLKWFEGEWKLGPKLGIPYYSDILVKNPSRLIIEGEIRKAILEVEEVKEVTKIEINVDNHKRELYVTWSAKCYSGNVEGSVILNV